MDSLKEAIAIPDKSQKHRAVKQLFSLSTAPINIAGQAELAIVALINLTERLEVIDDVFCRNNAKNKLLDEKFLNRCINTYQYRHSHNVKFPDYRAQGTLRLKPESCQFPGDSFKNSFGYAQTGADINYSIFLCAEFIYNNQLVCLGSALLNNDTGIQNALKSIGLSTKALNHMTSELQAIPEEQTIENLTGNYLPQLRFPFFNDEYISLSPVICNEFQSKVHQYCSQYFNFSTVYNLERSANVGSLAASTGGKLKLFKSIPNRFKSHHTKFDDDWNKHELLNILIRYQDLKNILVTNNKKSLLKKKYFEELVDNIKSWKQSKIQGSLDPIELTKVLNLDLSNHKKLSKFSYQPEYSRLFIKAFHRVVKHESTDVKPVKIVNGDESFILIPNLSINDANAMSTGATVGIPSLIGVWGFIHKFERNIKQFNNIDIKIHSFAACIHEFNLSKRTPTKESYLKENKKVLAPGLIDSIECDLSMSLVLLVSVQKKLHPKALLNSLPTKLCGGSVNLNFKDLSNFAHFESFNVAMKSISNKYGKWLAPHESEKNQLNQFLNTFQTGDFVLVCSGYLFLEKPADKHGVLDNLKHSFSESMLSCAKLTKHIYSQSHERLFWSYNYTNRSIFLAGKMREKL
jgi:CRISPR-associated protein Csy2